MNSDKLKNIISKKAHGNSDISQKFYQLFYFERILERISISSYRGQIILKGGLLLTSIIGDDERTTKDMDATLKGIPLTKNDVEKTVRIAGWVQVIRDLGGLLFIDLRDQYGITQAVVTVESGLIDIASKIPNESTISIEGKVRLRDEETINPNIITGEIEVVAEKIDILGKRLKNLPFEINSDKEVREDLRLQYRFLDLRNEKLKNNILLRAKILQ